MLPLQHVYSMQDLRNCQGLSASIHIRDANGSTPHAMISFSWLSVHSTRSSRDTLSSPQQLAMCTFSHAIPELPRGLALLNSSNPLAESSPCGLRNAVLAYSLPLKSRV